MTVDLVPRLSIVTLRESHIALFALDHSLIVYDQCLTALNNQRKYNRPVMLLWSVPLHGDQFINPSPIVHELRGREAYSCTGADCYHVVGVLMPPSPVSPFPMTVQSNQLQPADPLEPADKSERVEPFKPSGQLKPGILLRLLLGAVIGWVVWAGLAYVTLTGQHWFGVVLGLLAGISASRAKDPLFPNAGWLVNVAVVVVLTWVAILAGRFVGECAAHHDLYWDTHLEVTPEIARRRMAEKLMDQEYVEIDSAFARPAQPRTGGEPSLAKFPAEVEKIVMATWDQMSPVNREMYLAHWRDYQSGSRLQIERRTMHRAFGMAYQGLNLCWILGGSLLAGLLVLRMLPRPTVSPEGNDV